jgi:uncharacterized membrane protein YgdD (TMEM256/DUF423 family)
MQNIKLFLVIAGISGFLSVALGAFGAHGLKDKLGPEMLEIYQKGVQYQFYHTFALLAVAILWKLFPEANLFGTAAWLFIAGIIIFSGSLYVLSLSGVRWMGAITPVGGLCFLAGWLLLFWQAGKLAN